MTRKLFFTMLTFACGVAVAQDTLTVEECMAYAVAHSHGLRQRELQADNAEATRTQAIGAFLPGLSASAAAQYNFGRAIDPETNTYTSVSTFNNGYGLYASLPVFDGGYRLHSLRAARADVLLQKSALQAERDQVALQTYQAYVDVVYNTEAVRLAEEKVRESQMMLRQTLVMEEEGLKSPADVAQMQAQLAADSLTLVRQENLREGSRLKLMEVMNWDGNGPLLTSPKGEELISSGNTLYRNSSPLGEVGRGHPLLAQSFYSMESARHALGTARSAFYPSVSLSAGISTSYYKAINSPYGTSATPFGRQLKDNRGEYVAASISIPLFGRLSNLMSLRRAKNNLRIAQEQYEEKRTELEVLRQQAALDVAAAAKETRQTAAKVDADSLAYELVRQQYTEGLASPIDLQTSAATLLQSRAALLQSRLMQGVRAMQQRYYEGERLVP